MLEALNYKNQTANLEGLVTLMSRVHSKAAPKTKLSSAPVDLAIPPPFILATVSRFDSFIGSAFFSSWRAGEGDLSSPPLSELLRADVAIGFTRGLGPACVTTAVPLANWCPSSCWVQLPRLGCWSWATYRKAGFFVLLLGPASGETSQFLGSGFRDTCCRCGKRRCRNRWWWLVVWSGRPVCGSNCESFSCISWTCSTLGRTCG